MKKVALINPRSPFLREDGDRPPLNLGYLASSIMRVHDVRIFDFSVESEIDLLQQIKTFKPDIIGFTMTTPVFPEAVEILRKIKEFVDFQFISVAGGVHPTVLPESCLEHFDYVIKGEADITFMDFCKDHTQDKIITSKYPLNINKFLPARDLMPMHKYTMKFNGERCATLITSRGCPYNCIFCSSISGKQVRCNSILNVASELDDLISTYDYKSFYFLDDVFTYDKNRAIQICNWLRDCGTPVTFRATTRINLVDEKVLGALAEAGCQMLCYGLESGSDRVLQAYHKRFTVGDIRRVVAMTKRAGIGIKAFWLQSDYETPDDKKATLDLMAELKLEQNDLYTLTPYPGSKVWQEKHGDAKYFTAEYFRNYYHGGKNG